MTFVLNPFRTDPTATPANHWLGVVSIMAGIFAIVTAEIRPIGLFLPIASEFSVVPGVSVVMMTVPGSSPR